MNNCNFTGRVGKDPEGDKVRRFSIATKVYDGSKKENITVWVPLRYAGKAPIKKGDYLEIQGSFRNEEYKDKWYTYFWVDKLEYGPNPKKENGGSSQTPKEDDDDIPF